MTLRNAKSFARIFVVAVLAAPLGACIAPTSYVDNTMPDIAPGHYQAVANPKPAQLLFDFQTKGATNSRAREELQATVLDTVKESMIFVPVSPDPQPGGALVQVTINNVPLEDDAAAKGFMVGLTLGVAGTTVGDGYICTVQYSAGAGATPITKEVRDAIYSTIGATAPTPPHADKAPSMLEAAQRLTHKCVGNALDQLARDPAFPK
ncbi:MAG TPA: hypothetical protein VG387_14160 [Rhizomicrobium sp.]|jgi:hypothetical protein|nr:hypothetical protein [Rhizomicrobium sp.]